MANEIYSIVRVTCIVQLRGIVAVVPAHFEGRLPHELELLAAMIATRVIMFMI